MISSLEPNADFRLRMTRNKENPHPAEVKVPLKPLESQAWITCDCEKGIERILARCLVPVANIYIKRFKRWFEHGLREDQR